MQTPVLFKLGYIGFWKHIVWRINVGDTLEEMKEVGETEKEKETEAGRVKERIYSVKHPVFCVRL